jgi:hypothetical protein
VVADVVIHNVVRIGDKRELSLGYECDIEDAPGVTVTGERYDCIQKNIRYNHLAIVKKGRAGNARLRLDSSDGISFDMEEDNVTDVKLVTVRLDEIDYQAAPEVVNALNKGKEQLRELKTKFDSLEAERDTLKTAVSKHMQELDAARNGARNELKSRLELETVAESHGIKFDEVDTDRNIKAKIIGKLTPELKLDEKSDDYVDSAFDITIQNAKVKKVTSQKQRLDSRSTIVADVPPGALVARERMMARLRGETTTQET